MSGQIILPGVSKSRLIVRRTTGRHMKTYLIKFSDHEEGPYAEAQVAQMFADGRIDRNTPCKPSDGSEWKTVDDYLPMLKLSSQRVSVVDLDSPFGSLLKIMFKWMAAALVVFCCFLPVIFVLWLIVAAIFAALFSVAMSTFHHP